MFGTKLTRIVLLLLTLTFIPCWVSADDWQDGIDAFQRGDLTAAATSFQSVVERLPEWPGGHLMLGQTLLRAEQPAKALPSLETAYRLAPQNADGLLALGQARLVLGEAKAAATLLAEGSGIEMSERQRLAALTARGQALMTLRQPAEAAELLAEAARLSGDGRLNALLGRAWLDSGNSAAALPLLEQAAERAPRDAEISELLARALQHEAVNAESATKTELCSRAVAAVRNASAVKTSASRSRLLGEAQSCAGRHTEALDTFSRASKDAPDSWLLKFYAGREAALLENWQEAETWLRGSLAANPGDTYSERVWKQLGFVFESQQRYQEAVAAYRTAKAEDDASRAANSHRLALHNQELDRLADEIDHIRDQQKQVDEAIGNSLPY